MDQTLMDDLQKQSEKMTRVKEDIKCLKLEMRIFKLEQLVEGNKIKIEAAQKTKNDLLALADSRKWSKQQRSG